MYDVMMMMMKMKLLLLWLFVQESETGEFKKKLLGFLASSSSQVSRRAA